MLIIQAFVIVGIWNLEACYSLGGMGTLDPNLLNGICYEMNSFPSKSLLSALLITRYTKLWFKDP